MSRQIGNFTRGSQLLGHFGFMFAAGIKAPFWIAVATVLGLIAHQVATGLSDHEQYLALMRIEAIIYHWFEFDPARKVAIETLAGTRINLPWGDLATYAPVALAWGRFSAAVSWGATVGGLLMIPFVITYWWVAQYYGRRAKMRRHERGGRLVSAAELKEEIDARNSLKRAEDYARIFGSNWRVTTMLASQAELDAEGVYRPYRLAELPYPWRLEQSHGMLVGTTGTGKTVALSALVDQIRERDHRAVIFDLTGTFVERFYEERRDTILNPLDARCPQWSIFSECDSEAEFTTVWEALIPHDGGTSEPFWVQASRMLGIETSTKLKREGRGNNHALYTELMTADLRHVHKLVENTLADPITAPEAARMAESVRAVLNTNAKALRLLPRTGPTFSVKQWMLGDCAPGSILFLSSRYVDMSVNKILLTTWMDSALNTLMTMSRSRDVRMWFLVDELGALHRLNALDKGLQTARNYGGAIMLGLHSFARLEEVYGPKGATNLASLARTKLILATSDRQTATWSSDFIGHRQFRDIEENHSYGASSVRDAATLTQRRYLEPLVLPDEITDLPALHGIIKFPEGFPAARVELKIVDYPTVARGFVQRAVERSDEWTAPAPPPAAIGPAADGNDGATGGTGDGGAGPAVDLPEPGAAGAVGDQPKHEAATGTIGTEPQPLQPLLPLNPILQPVERTNPTSRASRIGRTKAGSGGEPLSELPGLRARKLPEVHVGENAAGDPLRPKMISPPPPDQVEKDLHTAFVEEPRGDPPSSIDDDLGIGD